MAAGADCDNTLSDKPISKTLAEFIQFLEPQLDIKDPKTGKILTPGRGAALCQSAEDWNSQKTSLEQACKILADNCTMEMKQQIAAVGTRLDALQTKIKSHGPVKSVKK